MKKKNDETEKGFKIKVKKRYFNFKVDNFILLLCIIIVAMMSGVIGAEIIVDSAIGVNSTIDNNKLDDNSALDDEAVAIKKVSSSLVTISDNEANIKSKVYKPGNVTGIVLFKNGYILTNYSGVKDLKKIYVKIATIIMDPTEGELIGFDELADIALIKINMENLTAIYMGDENDIVEGKKVIAIGNAISNEYVGIATPGIITSLNGIVTDKSSNTSLRLIQTNAVINEENTGGVIANLRGEIIGICSNKITTDKGKVGLFYGVGISEINSIVEGILGNTNIIGVIGAPVEQEKATDIRGFYVQSVEEGGLASKSGIKALDIIVSIDGNEVKSIEDIYDIIKDRELGELIKVKILRSGVQKDIEIYMN